MKHITIVALLLALTTLAAAADGRRDWRGYDWRTAPFGKCLNTDASCHAFHSKWDWKRNQWIDVVYRLLPNGSISVVQHLTNGDAKDSDFVCVTLLFLDAEGRNVAVSHHNVEVGPESSETLHSVLQLGPTMIGSIRTVEFGSKQCREGPGQDDHVWEAVKAELP